MTFTNDHDENSWNGADKELYGKGADVMAVLAATLPGIPLVYGGQEAGLNKNLPSLTRIRSTGPRIRKQTSIRSSSN